MTKLDFKRKQEAELKIREKNLTELQAELDKAKELLTVVNSNGNDFAAEQEKRVVRAKIRELQELIADEQRAYDATFSADEESISKVADYLTR